jgi:hypothetical protein
MRVHAATRTSAVGFAAAGVLAACAAGAPSRTPSAPAAAAASAAPAEVRPPEPPTSPCPAAWSALPSDDPFKIDAGAVILHASAAGTQDYVCKAVPSGGAAYAWTFLGPEAELSDCSGALVASHFASDAGASFPEWLARDGTYVIGQKVSAYTPIDGGASVPWLLLNAIASAGGDGGGLRLTRYIERLDSDGGSAPPAASCGPARADVTQKVPYTADYYFLAR